MFVNNQLLEKLRSCPVNSDEIHKYFSETADLLMNNYVISKHGIEYEIVEIEFYLFTPEHPDVITYPRDCVAGQWFFHQSGVDLTFATTDKQFGGILIRGLRETQGERKQVFGPQNCVNLLWDKFNAFETVATEIPLIIPSNQCVSSFHAQSFPRWIPVKKDKVKASAKLAEWIKRLKDKGYNEFNKDPEKISALIFDSEYRFIKEKAIDFDDTVWKRYNAKIKKD
jgi:hypothetical protein